MVLSLGSLPLLVAKGPIQILFDPEKSILTSPTLPLLDPHFGGPD